MRTSNHPYWGTRWCIGADLRPKKKPQSRTTPGLVYCRANLKLRPVREGMVLGALSWQRCVVLGQDSDYNNEVRAIIGRFTSMHSTEGFEARERAETRRANKEGEECMKSGMEETKRRRETVTSSSAKEQHRAKSGRSLTYAAISKRSSRTRLLTRLELRTHSAAQPGLRKGVWGISSFYFSQSLKDTVSRLFLRLGVGCPRSSKCLFQ